MSGLVLDAFAGMGGWSCAAAALGLDEIGIEIDEWACKTRCAAGHATIRANVATFPLEQLVGKVEGLIGSPPCPAFSASGKRAGMDVMHLILDAIDGIFANDPEPERILHEQCEDPTAPLVTEPARWALALRPRWIALEQVPPVMPIWNRIAHHLGGLGYSTWSGVLNSADYGVPQTRERAILIASLDRKVGPPPATHTKSPMPSLFGDTLLPWVSMAQALGWTPPPTGWFDPDEDPAPTWCGNGPPRWAYQRDTPAHDEMARHKPLVERLNELGAEGFTFGDIRPHAAIRDQDEPAPTIMAASDNGNYRFRVGFPRLDDRGDSPDGYRERDWRDGDEPAFTVTEKARSWVVQTGNNSHVTSREGSKAGEGGVEKYERSVDEPAPTLDTMTGSKWRVIGVNTGRDWKAGGTREDAQVVPAGEPAPTIDGKGRWHALVEEGENVNHADAPCEDAREVLRVLRDEVGEEAATAWATRVDARLQPAPLLRPEMCRNDGASEGSTDDGPGERPSASEDHEACRSLRGVWEPEGRSAPPGREPAEQHAEQLAAVLSQLPYQTASATCVVQSLREASRSEGTLQEALHALLNPRRPDANSGRARSDSQSIRLGIQDALVLQSFDPTYPVQGNKTKQFEQVGNAIPPLLAWHVLRRVVPE